MHLPDNVTFTRVYARVFSGDKQQVGAALEAMSLPGSAAQNPSFGGGARMEIRSGALTAGSTGLHPSLTLLLRVDTLDCSSLLPVAVGYAALKLFAVPAPAAGDGSFRMQPSADMPVSAVAGDSAGSRSSSSRNGSTYYINRGAFQLPLFGGRLSGGAKSYSESMLVDQGLPHIPCASILVRVLPAPKSTDGEIIVFQYILSK